MIELTSPPLKPCPFCRTDPRSERGYNWDLSYTFLRIECPQCGLSTAWIKYNPEDLASLQQAIDETSEHWNRYEILDDE